MATHRMAGVLDSERGLANEWMKGLLPSGQVIDEMGIQPSLGLLAACT